MDKILLASNNQHKIKEFNEILQGRFDLVSQSALNIEEIEETGLSFVENAILKARNASKAANLPAIADDSGIEVDALSGRPGIYSARLAKKKGSFTNAMKYLLRKLEKKNNRSATFICCLSLKSPNQKIITVVGQITGTISKKILGKKGFGYDPIFIPKNRRKTFGEIPKFKKMKMDHRFIAFRKLKKRVKIL